MIFMQIKKKNEKKSLIPKLPMINNYEKHFTVRLGRKSLQQI